MPTFIRLLAVLACLAALPAQAETPIPVMAGTSLIEDILKELAGPRLNVKTIIPAAACPGHYDVRTSDVAFLAQARVIFLHDWQERQTTLVSIMDAVQGAKERVIVVQAKGNWMVPDRQIEATKGIASALESADPANASLFSYNAQARCERVRDEGEKQRERIRLAGLKDAPVICDVMQRPFVEWLGLSVVADYGRFEEMGPEALAKTMSAAKAVGAKLVLDNMQSTGAAGKALAEDMGARHATLSNFPGGYPGADTWGTAVSKNVDLIIGAVSK